jgi:hypothetical protein
MSEVVLLAAQVRERAPVLDVLLNNAGVFEKSRHLTGDGLELTMAVNHYAPFLLTHHLLAAVSSARRLDGASGRAARSGRSNLLARLRRLRRLFGFQAGEHPVHGRAGEAARRHRGHHQLPASRGDRHEAAAVLRAGFGMGGAPLEEGARTSVYLATSPEVAGKSGRYYVDCRPATPSREARDEALATRLWKESERLLAGFL